MKQTAKKTRRPARVAARHARPGRRTTHAAPAPRTVAQVRHKLRRDADRVAKTLPQPPAPQIKDTAMEDASLLARQCRHAGSRDDACKFCIAKKLMEVKGFATMAKVRPPEELATCPVCHKRIQPGQAHYVAANNVGKIHLGCARGQLGMPVIEHPVTGQITATHLRALASAGSAQVPPLISIDGMRYRWVEVAWLGEGVARGDEVIVVNDMAIHPVTILPATPIPTDALPLPQTPAPAAAAQQSAVAQAVQAQLQATNAPALPTPAPVAAAPVAPETPAPQAAAAPVAAAPQAVPPVKRTRRAAGHGANSSAAGGAQRELVPPETH